MAVLAVTKKRLHGTPLLLKAAFAAMLVLCLFGARAQATRWVTATGDFRWDIKTAKRAESTVTFWYMGPVLDQQRAHLKTHFP